MTAKRSETDLKASHKAAIEVHLAGPRAHLLPQCTGHQGAYWLDQKGLVVRLETERGHTVLLPLTLDAIRDVSALLVGSLKFPSEVKDKLDGNR